MADFRIPGEKKVSTSAPDSDVEALPGGSDDVAAIPKGTIDPVYEAKARVLNHAVSSHFILADRKLRY